MDLLLLDRLRDAEALGVVNAAATGRPVLVQHDVVDGVVPLVVADLGSVVAHQPELNLDRPVLLRLCQEVGGREHVIAGVLAYLEYEGVAKRVGVVLVEGDPARNFR